MESLIALFSLGLGVEGYLFMIGERAGEGKFSNFHRSSWGLYPGWSAGLGSFQPVDNRISALFFSSSLSSVQTTRFFIASCSSCSSALSIALFSSGLGVEEYLFLGGGRAGTGRRLPCCRFC
ncbi:hypothetical protein FPQ18DRAFT_353080 [Pyronema domesticum]|nr:hypothetical protein FPQ18DRAFT_353080 [Pyronema domesticum]